MLPRPRATTKVAESQAPRPRIARRGRATVLWEGRAGARLEAQEFARLAARGIRDVERLIGRAGPARLRIEVLRDTGISAACGRTIRLPLHRVRERTAPYLHEIAHVLLPCPAAPAWFSEGLACYVESAVAERFGGYDSRLFTMQGNRGVDADARRWLADARGRAVLRFVGRRGMPPEVVSDRHNVATPFYVLSHSLVNFLVQRAGIPAVVRAARARNFGAGLQQATGKTAAKWRNAWLINLLRRRPTEARPAGAARAGGREQSGRSGR